MKNKLIKKLKKVNYVKLLKKIFKCIIKILKKLIIVSWYIFQRIFLILLFVGLAWWLSQKPSLYRDWNETESVLSEITFSGDTVDIKDIRNFKHISPTESIPGYYDKSFDLNEIESLYYIVEPFSDFDGPAHTMLSFGFSDGTYLVVSAELRKEKGEGFDPLLGLLNQFEIVYIIGDENDLVKLRSNIRKDIVRLYPMDASKEQIRDLFTSVLHRADKLSKEPEFYNTFWNTCTTSILGHVNSLRKDKISGFDLKVLLPSNSDIIAFKEGLIDTDLNLLDARDYYDITELSNNSIDDSVYSKVIRKERK